MKVTALVIVNGAPDKVTEDFVQGLIELEILWQEEIIQTIGLLGLAKILRRVLLT